MNPDNHNHTATRPVPGLPQHNTAPRTRDLPAASAPRSRRCAFPALFSLAALFAAASPTFAQPSTDYIHFTSATTKGDVVFRISDGSNGDIKSTGTLENSGTIIGTGNMPVLLDTGFTGMVINNADAMIKNQKSGDATNNQAVYFRGSGTLVNHGIISATSHANAYGFGVGAGILTGTNIGLIEGAQYGVQFTNFAAAGSTLFNSGTIVATGVAGTERGINVDIINTPITVTNTGAGLIQGGGYGLYLATGGGTFYNSGSITGTNAATGVGIYTTGTLTGTNIGLIEGGQYGIRFNNTTTTIGGSITNSGTIRATAADSRGVTANPNFITVNNLDGGLIEGAIYGIFLGDNGGVVNNSGSITGTAATGVGIYTTGTLTGDNTGLIEGGAYGIWLNNIRTADSDITNSGTIRAGGVGSTGLYANSAVVTVRNEAPGLIEGGTVGIWLAAGGTVRNSGTITGTTAAGGVGIHVAGAPADITNDAGALIEGASVGVRFGAGAAGSTLRNSGSIRAMLGSDGVVSVTSILIDNALDALIEGSDRGVVLQGGGTVANLGLIRGGTTGMQLTAGGSIANTGAITGTAESGYGISATNARIDITNTGAGLIQGGGYGIHLANGGGGGAFFNDGTISGTTANGVGIYTGGLLTGTNFGLIEGGIYGIQFNATNAAHSIITNSGTVTGTRGIVTTYGSVPITIINNAAGLIQGDTHGISLSTGGATITNSGTITGTAANGVGILTTGRIIVTNTGLIHGGNYGIHFNDNANAAGSDITNSGTITGTRGITSTGAAVAPVTLTNTGSGLIAGALYGVNLSAGGGTFYNSGTISGTNATGNTIGIQSSGKLTGTNAGLIAGSQFGINLNNTNVDGSDITNTGTIRAISTTINNNAGINVSQAISIIVTNSASGLIEGAYFGVQSTGGGTIANAGTISGTIATTGMGIRVSSTTAIENTGLVQGRQYGIQFDNADATDSTITNSGTIRNTAGNGRAVSSQSLITVDNLNAGLIEGGTAGVYLAIGGTVTNAGLIDTTADGWGVYVNAGEASVENQATGTIRGVYAGGTTAVVNDGVITGSGVWLSADSTLTGAGSIDATGTALTLLDGANHTNTTMNLIASEVGVSFLATGTLVNNARIEGTSRHGVEALNASVLVTNNAASLIQGGSAGMYLAAGGTVWNSGTITGTTAVTSHGLHATAAPAFVTNATDGLISGGSIGVQLAAGGSIANFGDIRGSYAGVQLDAGGSIANSGAIIGTASNRYGIWSGGAFTGTNSGLIQGGAVGIWLNAAGGTVWNSGTITGTTAGYVRGIHADDSFVITNNTDALIQSGYIGIYFTTGGTVVNSGTIAGATFNGIESYYNSMRLLAITNTTGGVIQGGNNGVYLAIGSLDNSGVIIGTTGAGVSSTKTFTGTNSAPGLIQGGAVGINLAAGGTVWNSGTITGTTAATSHGIYAAAPALITNATGGLISGGSIGVNFTAGGTVTNAGLIDTTADGWGVYVANGEASVENQPTGTIRGVYAGGTTAVVNDGVITGAGVWLSADSTLTGAGSIDATGTALTLLDGANHTNTTMNLIGSEVGVSFLGTGTLVNNARIEGTSRHGVEALNASVLVTNAAAGLIQGGSYGVYLAAGGTVWNSGTITGTTAASGIGISATSAHADITNAASGLIQGGIAGVYLAAGGSIANAGAITGTTANNSYGIYAEGSPAAVTNTTGALIRGGAIGVYLAAGGNVVNSGTIISTTAGGYGISTSGAPVLITNSADGLIKGGNYGVSLGRGGTIFNSGIISSTSAFAGSHGIYTSGAPVLITNTTGALIQGRIGIYFAASGTLINSGTVMGSIGNGIYAYGASVSITNTTGALIQGDGFGMQLAVGGTVWNSGTIIGMPMIGNTAYGVYAYGSSALITNAADGFISGGNHGVALAISGTVANSGTIAGVATNGIYAFGASVSITNTTGALIQGGTNGVSLAAGGTMWNSGTITGTSATSRGLYATGAPILITNATDGLISGGSIGVNLAAGGSVANFGVISGSGAGVWLDVGGSIANSGTIIGTTAATSHGIYASAAPAFVTNDAGALISGGQNGVYLADGGALANSGTITGTADTGVFALNAAVTVTNTTGALIEGGEVGVHLMNGGEITNAGLITAGLYNGVLLDAGGAVFNSGTILGNTSTNDDFNGIVTGQNPAYISNTTGALIHGGGNGVWLGTGGTVANSGTISGAVSNGIYAENASAFITNNAGGSITGGQQGVWLSAGGDVTNATTALIHGGTYGVYFTAGGTLANSGTITGMANDGVSTKNAPVSVTNNAGGLITGGQVGVALRAGGDVTNATTALIHGGWYGVNLTNGGTVLNSGSITADYHGIFSETASVTITNTTGGLVQGVYYGAHLTAGGSIANTGSITGGALGVYATSTPVAVNNGSGGRISGGSGVGVWTAAGGTVFNAGGIGGGSHGVYTDGAVSLVSNTTGASISGSNGVFLMAGGAVENAGRITGTGAGGIGVRAEIAALVTNTTGGEILAGLEGVWFLAGGTLANSGVITGSSAIGDGVYAEGAPALVTNDAGRITGGDTGVYFGAGGTLLNSGTITGTTAATGIGVRSIGAFTGSNAAAGLLSGGQYGAHLAAGGTLANSGTITGAVYNGVYAAGAPLLLTNDAGALVSGGYHGAGLYAGGTLVNAGVITGGVLGVSGSGAYVSLLNTGTINGGVNLTATVSSATLALGGKIDGGLAIAGGNGGADDTLTLAADDASGSQSHAAAVTGSTVFTGTLVKTGAGTWDLDANAADPASLAGLAQQATLVQAGTLAVDWAAHQLNAADPSAPPPSPAPADIAGGATLQIRKTTAAAVTLASPLTGAGYVDLFNTAAAAGGRFALAASTGDAFTGTIGVRGATPADTGHFLFDDNAETALTRATLRLGANSETTLDADRAIGGLHLDGGRLFIATNTAASPIVPHLLTVGTLSGAAGEFGLGDEALTGLDLPRPPGSGALTAGIFDVDATGIAGNRAPIVKVTDSSPLGNATAFTLVNTATAPLGESSTMDFHDATGTDIIGKISTGYKAVYYDPADAGADAAPAGKGVYLDYGVTAIESTHDAIAVTLDPTGSQDKTLSAKLTGTGAGFTFAGADTITLAQLADYTGATLVTGSAILKAGDGITDIIAASARVTLDGERTGFDLGAANQTLRELSGSGSIALRDATLTVNNTGYTGTLSGAITGGATGGLTLATGELALTGAAAYAGATAVQTGAALTIGDGATLGAIAAASRVTIAAGGTLALWRSDAITFANTVATDAGGILEIKAGSGATALTGALTGDGALVQNAAAPVTLTGANDIDLLVNHGSVQIGNGGATGNGWATDTLDRAITLAGSDAKLILNRAGALAIDTAITGAGGVDIIGAGGVTELRRAQTYTGATYARNNTLRAGAPNVLAASAGLTLENATLDLAGHNQTLRRLHGQGATGATVFYHTDQIQPDATPAAAYATLTTPELTGAITLNMNVDLAGHRADRLQVSTLATGSHHIVLRRTTTTAIDDARRTYALDILALPASVSADPAVLDITSNDLEIGAHTYRLHRGDGGNAMPGTNLFYLSGGEARSRAGDAIYLTAAVAGLDWHYSLDSLRKRMGELRLGGLPDTGNVGVTASASQGSPPAARRELPDTGSVWVAVNTSRLNAAASLAGDGFTQDSHAVTAGGDRRIDLPRGLTLLAGGFLSFARHDRDFDNHGTGETSGLGLGGYATVLHPDGWYGDFVLRADRSYNKLHAQSVDGFVTDARYGSDALGASLELGRRVTTGLFWLEPSMQAALVRLGGENYATERQTAYHEPIHVTIDGSTAAQYRLQLRAGVDLGRWRPNLRVAEVKSDTTGGALHVEGREWTPAFDGWRFETGLGASYLIDDQSQLYFDYEYNKAPAYERPWSLTLGYRRAW
jgi:hypothetical protein